MAHHYPRWIDDINDEVTKMPNPSEETSHWRKRSIYRIPPWVTDLNKRAYQPQLVSFGPYHHGSINLQPMEEHKHRALLHFLKRSKKPLQSFVDALTPVVEDLKGAYDQLESPWKYDDDDDEFVKLMIVDGCSMLEILRTVSETRQITTDYAIIDPIFSHHGKLYIMPHLKRDMLMLENQLPMLVLEKLVSVQNDKMLNKTHRNRYLTRLILSFFSQEIHIKDPYLFENSLHILDVYRSSLLVQDHRQWLKKRIIKAPIDQARNEIIRSATELSEAGITIKQSPTRSLKDISFDKGVLSLPPIVVDYAFESFYLNLMAFERFHVGAGNEVTSYVFFTNSIIKSARDVSLLHACGIIQNALGSDSDVAELFNSLSKDVTLDPDCSSDEVGKKLSTYCREPWHKWRANLMHAYFTNPWAILSIIAAFFLFALTIVQTVYTVVGYYKKTP